MGVGEEILIIAKQNAAKLDEIQKEVRAGFAARPTVANSASVRDERPINLALESSNVIVKSDPKRWAGPPMAGKRMSECPHDGLVMLANLYEWQASEDDKAGKTYVDKKGETVPASGYARFRARCALAWAERNANKPVQQDLLPDEL